MKPTWKVFLALANNYRVVLSAIFVALSCSSQCLADDVSTGQRVHLFHLVRGISLSTDSTKYCAPPGTEIVITSLDDGGTLHFFVDKLPAPLPASDPACTWINLSDNYSVSKTTLEATKVAAQGLVIGVLAVPFKFHLSDRASTAGSTIGGYVGYKWSVGNYFSITPVLGGGLALISTSQATVASTSSGTTTNPPATTSSSTSAGFSVAMGLITTIGNTNAQVGFIGGVDWLGRTANYQYEGKPWIAFEVGYNFLTAK